MKEPKAWTLSRTPNPTFPGYFIIKVRCPYCPKIHIHGDQPGQGWTHRVAHCVPGTPGAEAGYYVNVDELGEDERDRRETILEAVRQNPGRYSKHALLQGVPHRDRQAWAQSVDGLLMERVLMTEGQYNKLRVRE